MAAKKKEIEEGDENAELANFLNANKDSHFNMTEETEDYKVSTGSISWDAKCSGGLSAGMARFGGPSEGGKTSEVLTIMGNMLKTVPNSRGLYVKAEGRLSEEMQSRHDIHFVEKIEDWTDGTCFILKCNIFETVFEFIRILIRKNKAIKKPSERTKFGIIIDSMDGLIAQAEFDKDSSDPTKVAGGAVITSDFMKRVGLGMSQYKFLFMPISQVRAKIEVSKYAPQDPNGKMSSGTGGNAAIHYQDWMFEFVKPNQADLILPKPNERMGEGNEPIGHYVTVRIKKSPNETTNQTIRYPIKYGRKKGTSIWIEREVIDWLESLALISKSGTWFAFDETVVAEATEQGIEIKEKYQGMNNLYAEMETNRPLFDFLHKKVREILF